MKLRKRLKVVAALLAALLIIQAGMFTAFADDQEQNTIYTIDIGEICTVIWEDGAVPHITVTDSDHYSILSEMWFGPDGSVISGKYIQVQGGEYSYKLELNAKDGFVFDNSLNGFEYQGVNGDYSLHYDFGGENQDDNHTLIVTGVFSNIISAVNLANINSDDIARLIALVITGDYDKALDFLLVDSVPFSEKAVIDDCTSSVSNDTYSYKLVLKTKEGFTFENALDFIFEGEAYGYKLEYKYDLIDGQTLVITGTGKKTEPSGDTGGSALAPGASAIDADKAIVNMKNDNSPKGTAFSKLRFRSSAQTTSYIKLTWAKLDKAQSYVIYGNKCGKDNKPKRLAVTTGNVQNIYKIGGTNLKKGTYYKFIIVALDRNQKVVSASKVIHVAAKGGKYCNYKSVSVSSSVLNKAQNLKKGKTLSLNAKAVKQSSALIATRHVGLRYATNNKNIATVSSKGVITAKKKGTCHVYAYAQDGVYKSIKVVVK